MEKRRARVNTLAVVCALCNSALFSHFFSFSVRAEIRTHEEIGRYVRSTIFDHSENAHEYTGGRLRRYRQRTIFSLSLSLQAQSRATK